MNTPAAAVEARFPPRRSGASKQLRYTVEGAVLSDLPASELLDLCLVHSREEAWREFVRRFHPVIAANALRVAREYGLDSCAMIEDLVQDVYVHLCDDNCKVLREFRCERPEALFSFLKVLTSNLVRDRCTALLALKRGGGKAVPLSIDHHFLNSGSQFANQVEYQIFVTKVEDALADAAQPVAPRDRTVFWLYYRQGLTAREIAAIPAIGLTPKGVESLLHRLTRDIRCALQVAADDPQTGPSAPKASKREA